MKQIQLGSITMPAVGQGTMGIGGYYERDESNDAEQLRLLQLGFDLGLTVVDTAEVYGDGHAEELVGQAIAGRRHEIVVMSKFSAEHSRVNQIIAAAEASLRRLKTDYIDVYQPHWPNPQVPLEESLDALDRLMEMGKVRSVGLSNFQIPAAQQAIGSLFHGNLTCLQSEYNLAERSVEASLLPFCDFNGLVFVAYSPFQQGKLLKRDTRTELLRNLAADYSVSIAQMALAWLLRNPNILVIPKSGREASLRENSAALTLQIPPNDLNKLSDFFASSIEIVPISDIDVSTAEHGKKNYLTLNEALSNSLNMSPSPVEISREIIDSGGKLQKPIKVNYDNETGRFILIEGRLKYWGWLIAYGDKAGIPAIVERN